MNIRFLNILFLIFYSFSLRALETDNFTRRLEPLEDSISILNQEMQTHLNQILNKLNTQPGLNCDNKNQFYKLAYEELKGELVLGKIETFANQNIKVKKHEVSLNNSIYNGSYGYIKSLVSQSILSPSIRLNGYYIGTDKLGHFIDQGFELFQRYDQTKSLTNALILGHGQEKSIFGSWVSNINSWADKAANYKGVLFWWNLLSGENPYFTCQNNKWNLKKTFDWSNYVDNGWDEAINCSQYSDPEFTKNVDTNISAITKKLNKSKNQGFLKCPVDEEACKKLGLIYNKPIFTLYEGCRLKKGQGRNKETIGDSLFKSTGSTNNPATK